MRNCFVFGSCRIWKTAYKNKWSSTDATLHSHYTEEILQYLSWVQNKSSLSDEEMSCFRDKMTSERWEIIRQNYNKAKILLIEISSIKTLRRGSFWVNLLLRNDNEKNEMSKTLEKNIEKIIEIIPPNKKCIFFCHGNMYVRNTKSFIKNRTIIQECFVKILKNKKFYFIDPTEIINKYGCETCMEKRDDGEYDTNHYSERMIRLLGEEIVKIIPELDI